MKSGKWYRSFIVVKEVIKDLLGKGYSDYRIWGIIVLLVLLIGLYFKDQNTILFVTGLIIFFYTIETYKMRKAITENTELNTRPILVLEIDFLHWKAYIKNFSNFPAYNFRIEDYRFELGQEESPLFHKDFPILDIIPPKDRILILDGGTTDSDQVFFTLLNPSTPKTKAEEFTFKATALYDDIANKSWKMIVGYGGENIIATKPQKVQRRNKNKKQKGGEPD